MAHISIAMEDMPVEMLDFTPINPLISKCTVKVCYVGQEANRNRSIITKEVATDFAASIPGCPIVGFYNEKTEDFRYPTVEEGIAYISGKDLMREQSLNKQDIFITSFVSHFDISGKYSSELHSSNILEISLTLDKSHLEISGKDLILEHL